ncbi:zinc-binding dehydrogenase [Streptomyces sp. ME109]|uniref:zinc-binding dehydrogenase n=1 Tax=Streptomyces sp. me109 TaxID=1827853 RepID=UPI0021C6309D|nr:zinc-binding dehydrogenase [Streptomyces sp. me109]
MARAHDLTHIFGLLHDGGITAKIAARFPLSEVAEAMELAESSGRTSLGKIILTP